jgi:tetratricopeptide (TPR) repeat protein
MTTVTFARRTPARLPALATLAGLACCTLACGSLVGSNNGAFDAGVLSPQDTKGLLAAVDAMGAAKDKPKPFDVQSAIGNLYYEGARYLDAVDAYRLALATSLPVENELLALEAKGAVAAADLALECRRSGTTYGLEQIAEAAQKAAAADPAKALRCLREAIAPAILARARRGNALYLAGQPDGALAEHKRVLLLEKDYPESLFFVGAITLEQSKGNKEQLEEGKKWWRRLLEVAPEHPRAAIVKESLPKADELFTPKPAGPMVAGGGNALPAGHPPIAAGQASPGPVRPDAQLPSNHPPLDGAAPGAVGGNMPNAPMAHAGPSEQGAVPPGQTGPSAQTVAAMEDALRQTERTPELEKGLDDLSIQAEADLDAGKYTEARGKIVRVMPLRPNDARTAAIMGAAMRGLGRAEMAERVLGTALAKDPNNARANYELGLLYASRGDKANAKSKFEAVQAADAKFAAAHGVAAELQKVQ